MNKYLIFIIPVIILGLALGAFGYQYLNKQKSVQLDNQVASNSADDPNSSSRQFKIADLLNSDDSYHCTFDYQAVNEDSSRGEVFVAERGQKMRGIFVSSMGDRPDVEGNILRDGQYQYYWQTGEENGMKFLIDEVDEDIFSTGDNLGEEISDQAEEEIDETSPSDQSPDVNYSCTPWRVDESKFVVPSGINFVDFQAQMEQLKSSMPATEETNNEETSEVNVNCSMCDQVPAGEARQQCLSSLGCL